jgi:four helix bundle protein
MLEIALWLFEKVNTFPKKQRFVLGERIENSTLICIRLIIEANEAHSPQIILQKLYTLNIELEVLRSLMRVAYEMHFIKANSLGYITAQIDEVGKMRGGWVKRYKSSKSDNCRGLEGISSNSNFVDDGSIS